MSRAQLELSRRGGGWVAINRSTKISCEVSDGLWYSLDLGCGSTFTLRTRHTVVRVGDHEVEVDCPDLPSSVWTPGSQPTTLPTGLSLAIGQALRQEYDRLADAREYLLAMVGPIIDDGWTVMPHPITDMASLAEASGRTEGACKTFLSSFRRRIFDSSTGDRTSNEMFAHALITFWPFHDHHIAAWQQRAQ
ncbi:MAG TPA: hypothetical protein VF228_26015 [Iamia sp.]